MSGFEQLPSQHRHALLALRYLGGSATKGIDTFIASVTNAELNDLAELGLVRKRLFSWQLTLKGRRCIGNRRLVG
jgi:hypothetical protein